MTKKFLEQAFYLNRLIISHQRELEELEEMGTVISSPNYSGMPKSKRDSDPPFVKIVIKKIDLERQIKEEMYELFDLKKQIHDAINQVQDLQGQLLLRLRYIEFKKWEDVAIEMNYDLRWIFRLHSKLLKNSFAS